MKYEAGASPEELREVFYTYCPIAKILAGHLDGAKVQEYGGILRVDKVLRVHWVSQVHLKLKAIAQHINKNVFSIDALIEGHEELPQIQFGTARFDTELVAGIDFSPYGDDGKQFCRHNDSFCFHKKEIRLRFSPPTFEHEPDNDITNGVVMRGFMFRGIS